MAFDFMGLAMLPISIFTNRGTEWITSKIGEESTDCLRCSISPRPFYMVRWKSSMSVGGFSFMSLRPHTEHLVAEGLLVLQCLRFVLPILFLPSKAQRHALPCLSRGPHHSPCHLNISCPAKANRQHHKPHCHEI
jgi:hypothetical protein